MILENLEQETEIELIEPTENSSVLEITEENIEAHLKDLTSKYYYLEGIQIKDAFEAEFRQIVDRFDFIMTGPTALYQGQLVEAYAYKYEQPDEITLDPDKINFIYAISYLMLLSQEAFEPTLKRAVRFGSLPRNK